MRYNKIIIGISFLIIITLLVGCSSQHNSLKQKTIKIGVLVPLTGFGDLGEKMRKGADMALEEVNRENTQIKFQLVYDDSKCDPKTGLSAIKKMHEVDNINMVVGPLCSGVAMTISPYAEKSQVVLMHAGLAPKLKYAGDYIFRIVPGAEILASKEAELAEKLRIKKAALLYANTDFGVGYADAFKGAFEKLGGKIVIKEAFEQHATDYRTQLIKIQESGAKAIMLVGSPDEMGLAQKQMKELGMNITVFMPPSAESPVLITSGGDSVEGSIYSYGFDANATTGKQGEFIIKYKNKYGEEPSWHSALAYDAVKIYSKAVKDCGYITNSSCIKSDIYNIIYNGAQGKISFDSYGDANFPVTLKTIRKGKFVNYR